MIPYHSYITFCFTICLGHACAVQHKGEWLRAMIENVDRYGVDVLLVDSGDRIRIGAFALHNLSTR